VIAELIFAWRFVKLIGNALPVVFGFGKFPAEMSGSLNDVH